MRKSISTRRARRLREWVKATRGPGPLEGLAEDARKAHEEHRAKIDFLTSTPWRG